MEPMTAIGTRLVPRSHAPAVHECFIVPNLEILAWPRVARQDEANVKIRERLNKRGLFKRMRKSVLDGDWAEVERLCTRSSFKSHRPSTRPNRVSVCVARTLNPIRPSRVTLSQWQGQLRAGRGSRQEESGA